MKHVMLALVAASVAGCSTIIEGTSQEITVNTNPAGASCNLTRQGVSIARVDQTPGAATIKKTKYDITVVCDKPGYIQATYINHSGVAGATVGNVIAGGLMGWAVDSASGADNKYDGTINITLAQAATEPAPAPSTPAPATPAAPGSPAAPSPGT